MQDSHDKEQTKITVNRPLVGIISLVCLITAVVLYLQNPTDDYRRMWVASFVRAGLMTGAIWLALPTRTRAAAWANVSPWTLIGFIGGIIAVAARPKAVLFMIPILIALAILGYLLKPRGKRGNRPDRDSWKP